MMGLGCNYELHRICNLIWCKRGLVCMCLEPFTPSRNYGAEFSERSEIRPV